MILAGATGIFLIAGSFTPLEDQSPQELHTENVSSSQLASEPQASEPARLLGSELEDDANVPGDVINDPVIAQKREAAQQLVEQAAEFFASATLETFCHAISSDKKFNVGELYVFMFNGNGVCFAHGQEESLIWKNMWNEKDIFNVFFVQMIIQKGRSGGGWVTYQWRGATKKTYVKQVMKDGVAYVLGAGFYPQSKEDAVVNLVNGAVAYFNQIVLEAGYPPSEAFSTLTYSQGSFVFGDLYLYAMDFEGNQTVHGERPGFVGVNELDYRDSRGTYVNREIIKKLNESAGGPVWVEYYSKNAPKIAYAHQVVDKTGKRYFIACGYYPTATRERAVELVNAAYEHMKRHGKSESVDVFTDRRSDAFRFGDLYIAVYDYQGNVIAHGGNAELVGMNQWNIRDADGVFVVREIIAKAKEGGGWIHTKDKNSFRSSYVVPVKIGLETYAITSSLFPISKQESMMLLVRSAAGELRSKKRTEALGDFSNRDGNFIRGDLSIFVYDQNGILLVYGDEFELIWRNVMNAEDDTGKKYVRLIIEAVRHGPAHVTYVINGAKRVVYAEQVSNGSETYIVGSGYFA